MLPKSHPDIELDGQTFRLGHLSSFICAIQNKGLVAGTDLPVMVCFSNHVFSDRAKHGEIAHFHDHHGTARRFSGQRYAFSLDLPDLLRGLIARNALTFVSKSFGGSENLILLEDRAGAIWTIVYCLWPEPKVHGVRMDVLSIHPKEILPKTIKRSHLSQFARACLHRKERVPK